MVQILKDLSKLNIQTIDSTSRYEVSIYEIRKDFFLNSTLQTPNSDRLNSYPALFYPNCVDTLPPGRYNRNEHSNMR